MSDPRTIAANARVVDASLAADFPDLAPVIGLPRRITSPVVDLLKAPGGPRNRQLLFGAEVLVYEDRDGWSFVQAKRDGYVGYVPIAALGTQQGTTHWVSAPSAHIYQAADIKSRDQMPLSFGSRVCATATTDKFVQTADGFIPKVHLSRIDHRSSDPVGVAALFLGTPYLWGGNSRFGIDCSGLVQAALHACGQDCPGDSDQQQAMLGRELPPGTRPIRGDLLFWKGHVAMVVDDLNMIHANGYTMSVAYENIDRAIARIADQGEGPVIAHKRL